MAGQFSANELGVTTFGDLKISEADDPGMSLLPERRYRVVLHTSDITRAELVRLPWDFNYYGLDRDNEQVVRAVRASMSIPFFFEPVIVQANPADVTIPGPGNASTTQHYGGGSVTWVDGGMLANFPIDAFDRVDGQPPRLGQPSVSSCRLKRSRCPRPSPAMTLLRRRCAVFEP